MTNAIHNRKNVHVLRAAALAGAALCTVAMAGPAGDAAAHQAKVANTFAVGGEGRWDYITADASTHRLYVPRSTHVQVLDSETGKQVADWPETAGVHGVAVAADKGLAFSSNGQANTVSVFDLKTDKKIADVKTGTGPDAILYDASSNQVMAFNHKGGTITFISADRDAKFPAKELEVGGALEAGVVDGAGHGFVSVEDKNEVVEFDTKNATVLKHWPLGTGQGPTGLAIDTEKHRLFVGCGENDFLVVMDSESGEVKDSLPMGKRCDGCGFDAGLKQAYASCGDGTLAIAREGADGHYAIAQTLPTKVGARTIGVDSSTHRIYLPTAEFEPAEAGKRPAMKPGTFQIVVVDAAS